MNVGIIGLGKLGTVRFNLLREYENVRVVNFYDPEVQTHEGVVGANSADEVINDSSIDAVVVCVPNSHAKTYVTNALRAGKHVLCEKPPGVSLSEAEDMMSLDQQHAPLVLKFGFNHRYLSHFQELNDIKKKGTYGNMLWIRGVYGKGYDEAVRTQWRVDRAQAGGGILIDQGIHMLDLMLYLVDDATVEHASVDTLKWHGTGVEDNVFAHLRSHSGIPIALHSSMVHWPHTFRLEVGFDEAVVSLTGVKSSTRSYGDEIMRIECGWRDNFVEVHTKKHNEVDYYTLRADTADWLTAIRNGNVLQHGTSEDAVRVMKAIDGIYNYAPSRVADRVTATHRL